ncbi:MAG: hypothetical protein WAV41_03315 [Microgenomates group bacterium]
MGRLFAVPENWNAKSRPTTHKLSKIELGDDVAFLKELMIGSPNTTHHEPEKSELKRRGIPDYIDQAGIPMTHDLHVIFHEERAKLFGKTGDKDAARGQISNMDEAEVDNYDRLSIMPEVRAKVREVIKSRRIKFGL